MGQKTQRDVLFCVQFRSRFLVTLSHSAIVLGLLLLCCRRCRRPVCCYYCCCRSRISSVFYSICLYIFFSLLLLRQIRRAEVGASAMWMLYMHVLNFLFRFMPFSFLFFVCAAFSVDFVCALLFFLFCFDGLFSILSCYFFSLYYCWRSLRLSSAQNQWAFPCSQSFAYFFNFFFSLRSFTLNFV